jgi:hypothetical protein
VPLILLAQGLLCGLEICCILWESKGILLMATTFAVYSKFQNVVRVHYSHLTEDQAQNEVDRMNAYCVDSGHPAIYWYEDHHPECMFVIG